MESMTAWVWVIPVFFSISASCSCVIEGMRTLSCLVLATASLHGYGIPIAYFGGGVDLLCRVVETLSILAGADKGIIRVVVDAELFVGILTVVLYQLVFRDLADGLHFLYPPRLGVPYLLSDNSIAIRYTFVKGKSDYFLRAENAGFWA